MLECVNKFCFLGDVISVGSGVLDDSLSRVTGGWKKVCEILPVLIYRRWTLHQKGKIYVACVESVMMFDIEIWTLKKKDLHKFASPKTSLFK